MSAPYETFTNQRQWEIYIKKVLATNNEALKRALLIVYDNQTADEKITSVSLVDNGKGFSKVDANVLTSAAKDVLSGKGLTPIELSNVRHRMLKYWRQIMVVSKNNINNQNKTVDEKYGVIKQFENELKEFEQLNETLRMCMCGHPCKYRACDKCVIGSPTQLRLNL